MKPEILTLNVNTNIASALRDKGYNLFEGNLGKLVKLKIDYNSYTHCRPNATIPQNLHEFDIVVIDLNNIEIVDYQKQDHVIQASKSTKQYYLRCFHPQNIFDPRPLVLSSLYSGIQELLKKPFILLVFCSQDETLTYHWAEVTGHQTEIENKSTYSFYDMPHQSHKHGSKTHIRQGNEEIFHLLNKYNEDFTYDNIFSHPNTYEKGNLIKAKNFHPLMFNDRNEIIGFCQSHEDSLAFFLPDLKERKECFLIDFLEDVGPSFVPQIFPGSNKNSWLNEEAYILPNQINLLDKRQKEIERHQAEIAEIDQQIEKNTSEYSWLHDLLTKTDEDLVDAVIKYLTWLGFKDVKNGDEINTGTVKEEDIQIDTDEGLVIIEVKGIGGTSKDSDCSQIGKIKSRRIKQQKRFDVYGVFVVNHQRHLPPLQRKNPPFTEHQISDALYDERGLVTTWQLFQLYFLIQKNVLTKDQARAAFYTNGLIDFIPKDFIALGSPKEYYKNNSVIVIDIPVAIRISKSDKLFIISNGVYDKIRIESLKVDDKNVDSVCGGEVGIKLSRSISKGSLLFFKASANS